MEEGPTTREQIDAFQCTGLGQAHHGVILREAAALADGGKLRPLLNKQRFSSADIDAAHALVESGALGKVVVDL